MPRPKKVGTPRAVSRPQIPLDWDRIDALLEAGCPGTEIAAHLKVCPATIYERVESEKGMLFTEYAAAKKSRGESIIREVQYLKAIGETEKGDNTMLVWLGKNRLNQKETSDINVSPETVKAFTSVMSQLNDLQKERQNNDIQVRTVQETQEEK